MMKKITTLILFCLAVLNFSHAQNPEDSIQTDEFPRYYELLIAPNYDLHNSALNGLTVFKGALDIYDFGLRKKLPKKLGNVLGGIWSFSVTYLSMIWQHEFGHSLRASQSGGYFKIHNFALPFPHTTMHLPENADYEISALAVTGGFEVNYLSAQKIQNDFYEYNGAYNDELSLAFAHRIMYMIYASLIIPRNPELPETWIHTGGDPVHFVKPVWQMYSNDPIISEDSIVDKGIVKFYNQSALFATFWNLADPAFYKQVAALFGDTKQGKRPWFIFGNETKGWSYGTMFNTSPLGYELYLNNYFKFKDKLFVLYGKYGRPFKNNAFGFHSPNLYTHKDMKLGISGEFWDQARYGKGFALCSDIHWNFYNKTGIHLQAGYKTHGYMLGRKIEKGFIGFVGLRYQLQ